MPSYGVFAIMEYGTQGAFGIFGVVGETLTKINSSHYGVAGSGDLFEISKSMDTYTITSRTGGTTRHAVLGFVHV